MATNNSNDAVICYVPTMITTNGIWQGDNPLDYSLPLFILQLTLIVVVTRIMVYILKPLHQPRVVAEILGGLILGPSVLGQDKKIANYIFPLRSAMVLETMANVGLLYFLFLVGVEMDITVIRQTGKKSLAIALAGMILPFLVGISFAFLLHSSESAVSRGTYVLFLGVALSVTSFPVLARILAELKLLNTEIGLLAMSSALINDICAWILLVIAIALAEHESASLVSLWVLLSSVTFVLVCVFLVRPAIAWMIRRTPEGESFSDFYICLILTGVMISSFVTDALGTHSVLGAFVFGLIIPNGPLRAILIEKLEDFISGLLLPLYFAISGLRTNLSAIMGVSSWMYLILLIVLGAMGKVVGTLLVCALYQMTMREGVALGLLMNTKGLVEMIILNVGRDQNVLDEATFATMVVVTVIVTGIVTPIVTVIYKPSRRFIPYKLRTVQRSKPEAEFRILICVHTPRNVPTMINLLEASNPTKKSPFGVYVLHLVELTGRASAMLIVHNTRKSGRPALNRTQAQSDHILHAFEIYEQHASYVTVQPLTAISPYSTMHEDICNLAEDKRVALIIIPFHKKQTVDGGMEAANPAYRMINQNVLANAPCSVGILIDRGLNGSTRLSGNQMSHHIAVLFCGGPDDREALAYGCKMADHPGINLTVLRFIPGSETAEVTFPPCAHSGGERVLTVETNADRSKQLDEEYLNNFRTKNANNNSVFFLEKEVNNGEETVAAIRSIDSSHDLFIVGRGHGMISPLTAGLTDWSECPELGPIGDLLASSDFTATVSVLVIQQYVGGLQGDGIGTPDSPGMTNDHFGQHMNQRPPQPRSTDPSCPST